MGDEHTPGPWEPDIEKERGNQWFTIKAAIVGRYGVVADTLNRDCVIDPDEDRANANLIAAAPDLLAACEAAVDHISNDHWAIKRMLVDAIAKAKP